MPKADRPIGPTAAALAHIDEAMSLLTLECYRAPADTPPDARMRWTPVSDFTLAEELERIDSALGPAGNSMFAWMGDKVRRAYVEIKAARKVLEASHDHL